MVEKMKKYSFLIYYKSYNEFLESLQQAGVVHVVEKQKGVPEDATDLRKQLATADLLNNTIRALQNRLSKLNDASLRPLDPTVNGDNVLSEYERLLSLDEQLTAQQQNIQKEIDNMSVWGDFDFEMLRKLDEAGRHVKFYSCRDREFQADWAKTFNAVEVARMGTHIYFITVTPTGFDEEPEAEKMRISEKSLGQLKTALSENRNQASEVQKQFDTIAVEQFNNLKEKQRQLHEKIDLSKVHLQAEKKADDKLVLLEGWVPEVRESDLLRMLEAQNDVYYVSGTPDKNEKSAPILLKNNKFARLFEPIGEIYQFPNYHELDLTPFFAPWFMLFFGICLGDAGYGMLILLATLFVRSKVSPSLKPILSLGSVLGAATVLCGIVGGTFFGIPLLDMEWEWLASFKKVMMNHDQMFNMALYLGVAQIIFGMFVRAYATIRRYGWAYSLETWGWIILFIGVGIWYFASDKELLSPDMAKYVLYGVLGVAGLFIFVLNTPGRNPLINILAGLWNTFNMATGVLGDLLSYIRLFALGLCGGVMGFVFNELAMELSGDTPVISHIIMVIILLLGHSLNIFMSGLGAFVHPMRLTFVEFFKNAGFEGGGKKYKPFSYISAEN